MYHNKNPNSRIQLGRNFFVQVFVLIAVAAIAVGDVEQSATQADANESIEQENPQISRSEDAVDTSGLGLQVGEEIVLDGNIKLLNFKKDATIQRALWILGEMYQKNIVPSAKVEGVLPFRSLKNVTFEEAMGAILGTNFKYEQEGNLIKVYTKEEYKEIKEDKSRRAQRVFTLYYVNAAEVKKLIAPVLSSSGTMAASTAAEVDTDAGTGGDSLAMHDAVVVYDFPENIEKVARIINEVDVRPPEILIEVTILEAELKDETEFGIDLSTVGGVAITSGATEGISTSGFAGSVTGTTGFTAALSIDDVTGFIRALESVTETTVLANPKIVALNKQAGHILIGESDGYLTTTQVTAEGRVQQVEFLESGTRLRFRPYICKDGYIRMEIYPEQSTGVVSVSGDFVLPSKETTEVKTNIIVKDGKTIVIGGLFKEKTEKRYAQVPILGDLPLLGPIFRQVHDTAVRTELIVLITPHIIHEPEETQGDRRSEEVKRMGHGARKSLDRIGRSRIFEERFAKAVEYYIDGDLYAAMSELNHILRARPNFLNAIKLKERIIVEADPDAAARMERIMLDKVERKESDKWQRK